MGKLAQQLSGQSQVKVANVKGKKGVKVESMEPKREERKEAKMSPKMRMKKERGED